MENERTLRNFSNASKLLNMTCDTLLLLANDGTFTDVIIKTSNPYINESAKLVGKNIFNVFPKITLKEFKPEFENVVATGENSNKNYDLPFEDKMFYFKCIIHKYDENHILCQYRDITQRSQMKKRLQTANITLREVERAAKIGHWNYNAATQIFEYTGFVKGAYKEYENESIFFSKSEYLAFIHPDDKHAFISLFEKGKINHVVEYRIILKNKVSYLCCKLINKRYDGDQEILEGYIQNISSIVKERQEMEMVTSVVNNSSESIYAIKINGTLVFANKRCRLLNNINPKIDITQKKADEILKNIPTLDVWNRLVKNIQNNNNVLHFSCNDKFPQFNILASECSSYIIKNGLGEEIVWTFMRDISDHIRYEQELKKAKEIAEESDRLKTAFVSNMSHEIRTPLNAIVGFSDIITQIDDAVQRNEFSEIIKSNSSQLLNLVNEVLDLSRMETENFKFNNEMLSLNTLGYELETIHRLNCKSIEFLFDKPESDYILYSDKHRLMQVLSNLITNAIKFTSQGSIHFGYIVKQNFVEFYVKDTGIGIKKEYLDKIFDRFVKLNSFDQGTGLGLAICKTIVEKMGGRISVESVFNQGTTFRFTIPIEKINNK